MRVKIDRMAPDFRDWTRLHRLLTEAFADMHERIDPPSSLRRLDVSGLREKATRELLFLAIEADELVGCCFLRPELPRMYIGKLAVRHDRRGRGVGQDLVQQAVTCATERGASEVELQVRVELTENRRFFESQGFVKVGETAHAGYDRSTSITMRRACGACPGDSGAPAGHSA